VSARRDLSGTAVAAVASTRRGNRATSRRAPGHRVQSTPGDPGVLPRQARHPAERRVQVTARRHLSHGHRLTPG
jgi:hypothetical protein